MEVIAIILLFGIWIWSVVRGLEVSVLCAALSFAFPPLAQVIFSVYEERLRAPMIGLLACLLVIYVN